MSIYVRREAEVEVTEYSYTEGESLHPEYTFDFDVKGMYNMIQDLINELHKYLPYFSDSIDNWVGLPESWGEMATLQSDALVSLDSYSGYLTEASKEEIEKWKRGELKLYNTHIFVPVEIGEIRNITYDDFEEMGIEVS